MYAASAAAAGVGALALAAPAGADVVFTPVHHAIARNSSYGLDLNHDGKIDFYLNETQGCSTFFCKTRLYAYIPFYKDPGNAVAGQKTFPFHAIALREGSRIDFHLPFGGTALFFRSRSRGVDSGPCSGSWVDTQNRYLGVKFLIQKEVHFGWIEVSATCNSKSDVVGVVSGYAYETVPNKPIAAGQRSGSAWVAPASLRQLALGARGLEAWRRRDLPAVSNRD
jgi:hypothetical protein